MTIIIITLISNCFLPSLLTIGKSFMKVKEKSRIIKHNFNWLNIDKQSNKQTKNESLR